MGPGRMGVRTRSACSPKEAAENHSAADAGADAAASSTESEASRRSSIFTPSLASQLAPAMELEIEIDQSTVHPDR